jgi:hypothetical protein
MQVNGSTLWHARIARSSLEQNQHKRVGEFWLLNCNIIIGKPQKKIVFVKSMKR